MTIQGEQRADTTQHHVYIGIGSNLCDPLKQVCSAIDALKMQANFDFVGHSPWYQSVAIGPQDQADYINGAALLVTALPPEAVLDVLQSIENAQGRERSVRWGPRTLDLDLLLYGTTPINTARLCVPHPEIARRNFVIRPLLDLTPDLRLPDGRTLTDILHIIGEDDLKRLPDPTPERTDKRLPT